VKVVFCTTCKGRMSHLLETLPRNATSNPSATFVVLSYGDDELDANFKFSQQNIVYYKYETSEKFHVAHAKNMAMRCGMLEGADILVTLDADNFAPPGFADFIECRFFSYAWKNSHPMTFLAPNFHHIQSLPHGPDRPNRGFAGRLAISTQDFIKMGGYDESFNVWGSEDIDLLARLERLGYTAEYIPNQFLSVIPHNAEVRFKEYPHARQYENKQHIKSLGARIETVVNYGNIGRGEVYRNFGTHPIKIKRLPTRIFGIGMHKTATTSLNRAFQILGFDSLHWGTGEAPKIWQEMNLTGESKTLEQFYALSDLPIPLFYKELDKAYPGSKFILTIRDEAKWLNSVQKLWSYEHNPTRKLWDKYPISNRLHKAMYGIEHFDSEVFINRYRAHNAEVIEYFKGRWEDLLVLDLEVENPWTYLCTFLSKPIPEVKFPYLNISLIPANFDYTCEDVDVYATENEKEKINESNDESVKVDGRNECDVRSNGQSAIEKEKSIFKFVKEKEDGRWKETIKHIWKNCKSFLTKCLARLC